MTTTSLLTIYLFGGTGDLSRKKLLPAIFYLYSKNLLPKFRVVAIARKKLTRLEYWQYLTDVVAPAETSIWQEFLEHVEYVSGDSEGDGLYEELADELKRSNITGDRIFYLATLPQLYSAIALQLRAHHLIDNDACWSRLLVEKPFGVDVASSRALNAELLLSFPEESIFRIDHFLAKETVQNMLAFRFANGIFENLWNNNFVDHIQITSAEPFGVEGREQFYNDVGVVRDVVQNHCLSLLAIALMEEPGSLDPRAIQRERLRLLSQIEVTDASLVAQRVAFGQYESQSQETAAALSPRVPTAVAMRLSVLNDRWKNVPIYIRAGKKFPSRITELSVIFKEPANHMFGSVAVAQSASVLTFRIQPNEGIIVSVNVKRPGFEYGIDRVPMSFCYASTFTDATLPEAYSKVIYDAIKGDPTLFLDEKGVDASWAAVDPFVAWQDTTPQLPEVYVPSTWGPASFTELIRHDGRSWLEPDLTVCSI